MTVGNDRKGGWYIEKGVPVAIIATIIVQLLVLGWTASKYDSHFITQDAAIANQDRRLIDIAHQTQTNVETINSVSNRMSHIEGQLEFLVQNAHDVKHALEQKDNEHNRQ